MTQAAHASANEAPAGTTKIEIGSVICSECYLPNTLDESGKCGPCRSFPRAARGMRTVTDSGNWLGRVWRWFRLISPVTAAPSRD